MGSLKDLASMIPGMGKALKDVEIKEDAFKSIKAIIGSIHFSGNLGLYLIGHFLSVDQLHILYVFIV